MYESNIFLEHIAGDAAATMKRIDEMLDGLIAAMPKEFETSLKAATSTIKDDVLKATLSLNKQAQVAWWNVGVTTPGEPLMPPTLVGSTASTTSAACVSGSLGQFELNSDEDLSDPDHTGNKDEGDDELGVESAA